MNNNEDYLLKIKVLNNHIATLMREQGIESVSELSRRTKISQGTLGKLLNMTETLYTNITAPGENLC